MSNFITNFYHSLLPNKNNYLVFSQGESNLILSAPHSGNIKPINIPNRKYGNRSRDTYTLELIKRIIELLPKKPFYIYSNIHRVKIDFNRNIKEASQGNSSMESLWETWNYKLRDFQNEVRFYYKKGLYIDIHSHNNSDEFQIGYGLSAKDYNILMKDEKIPTKNSTMHSLKEFSRSEYVTEHSVLFGQNSIYYNMEKAGFKVAKPTNDKTFLNGGRDITEFSGNGIGSLQIECPVSVLKYNLNGVAKSLVYSINTFSTKFL